MDRADKWRKVRMTLVSRQQVLAKPGSPDPAKAPVSGQRSESREEDMSGSARTVVECTADYLRSGEIHVVRYEEHDPESGEITHVCMKIAPDKMVIERRGAACAVIELVPSQDRTCLYETPLGTIPMTFRTARLTVQSVQTAQELRVSSRVFYSILQEGSEAVRCAVTCTLTGPETDLPI